MSPLAKVFVVINMVLAICFLGVASTLFTARDNWKANYDEQASAFEEFAEETKEAAQKWEGQLTSARENISNLKVEGARLVESNTNLSADVQDLKTERNRLQSEVAQLNTRIQEKDNAIADKDAAYAGLEQRYDSRGQDLKKAEEDAKHHKLLMNRVALDNQNLKKALADSNTLNNSITNERDELASSMARVKELSPDVYRRITVDAPPPPIDGQIVDVRATQNIVVISVGQDDEVKPGYEFTVYRRDKFLGKIRVTKVTADLAGAKILYLDDSGQQIEVGDRVSTRLSY